MDSPTGFIPVLYLESRDHSDNLLMYFHGNGEDVFSSYPLLDHLRTTLEVLFVMTLSVLIFVFLSKDKRDGCRISRIWELQIW